MKLISVVGARPQFIKAGVMIQAIESQQVPDSRIRHVLVHTGQHYDYGLSQVFFDELKIPKPDYYLGVGSGGHGEQTGQMLERVEQFLLKENPDMVFVYGDTNSTLAGALAAANLHALVAHVESGLRTYNKRMPEERIQMGKNGLKYVKKHYDIRVLTDRLEEIIASGHTEEIGK